MTEYSYSVAIATQDGGELRSEPQSGSFHQLLATWPLPDAVVMTRLSIEKEESITALVETQEGFENHHVELFQFDRESGAILEQLAFRRTYEALNVHENGFLFGSVTTAVTPEGWRFLSLVPWSDRKRAHLFAFDPGGSLSWTRHELFGDELSALVSDPRSQVSGEVSLWGGHSTGQGRGDNVIWNEATVSRANGELLLTENFEAARQTAWEPPAPWAVFFDGFFSEEIGFGGIRFSDDGHDEFLELARYRDGQWADFRFEAELALERQSAAIQIGSDANESSRFRLTLHVYDQQVTLDWLYRLDGEDELLDRFIVPFPVYDKSLFRLGLGLVDGELEAWVDTPFRWTRAVGSAEGGFEVTAVWTSMVSVDDGIGVTRDHEWYDLSEEGIELRRQTNKSQVSEIRIWEEEVSGERMMGLSFPATNEILYARLGPRSAVGNLG